GRRRRRWPVVSAAAVAVAAVVTAGVWAAMGPPGTPDDGKPPGGGLGPAVSESSSPSPSASPDTASPPAAVFAPWERDLLELGVRDITENPLCLPLGGEGDRLLCASDFAATVALNAQDGSELWRYNPPRTAFTWPRVVVSPDAVFTPSPRGVVALDPEDGTELWEIDVPELGQSMARTDSSLVVQSGNSTLRFYALGSPDPLGEWEAPGRYLTQLAGHGAKVLVEHRDELDDLPGLRAELMLLDEQGGPLWPAPVEPPPEAYDLRLIGMDADAAYFDMYDSEAAPVSVAVWRLDLADREWRRTDLPEGSEPRTTLGEDGTVYATDGAGRLTALDARAGEQLWSVQTGAAGPSSELTVTGGSLFFSGSDGRLHQVDASDGTLLWSGEAHKGTPGWGSDAYPSAPAVIGDRVYVVTTGNTLYATRPGATAGP
ncbi:PQQ-binding-like beta-propeller repeat protein, partial [Streptomyces sp. YIM 98790]|uniref:outer membrane protein assembly factor BamB family protein n=1 Tax=Streptomyces sp. YIM 98790 TaxID=2689077 RepID=UPI00140DFB96